MEWKLNENGKCRKKQVLGDEIFHFSLVAMVLSDGDGVMASSRLFTSLNFIFSVILSRCENGNEIIHFNLGRYDNNFHSK